MTNPVICPMGGGPEPTTGSTCHITNKLNQKVLDVEYGEAKEGNPVLMWEKKNPPVQNQLWIFEPCDGNYHIVSCLNPCFVLTFKDNPNGCGYYATVCQKIQPPCPTQLFKWCDDNIVCLFGENLCVDVEGVCTNDGALVVLGLQSGLISQHWYTEECCIGEMQQFPQPTPLQVPQGFFIENNAVDRVFTVVDGNATEGTHVVSSAKKYPPSLNQMWNMTDAGGNGYYFIESMLNPNLVLDVEQGNTNSVGQHLIIWGRKINTGNENQLFRWNGNMLESALNPSLVLEIENPWDVDGSKIMTGQVGSEYEQKRSWNMVPAIFHTGM